MADDESQASAEDHHRRQYSSPSTSLERGTSDDYELHDELAKAMEDEHNSRWEAFEESIKRMEALKDAILTVRRRERKDFEEALAKAAEDREKMSQQVDVMAAGLCTSIEQRSALEQMVQELEQNMDSAMQQLDSAMQQLEMCKSERDDAIEVAEELRRKQDEDALLRLISEENRPIPPYFICPISLEIMQAPHFAADGYTYELEAFTEWLDSGRDTSPMTNLQLPHRNVVPNLALRSAIQEWQQQQ